MTDFGGITKEIISFITKQNYNQALELCKEYRVKYKSLDLMLADIYEHFGLAGKAAEILEIDAAMERENKELKKRLKKRSAELYEKAKCDAVSFKIYMEIWKESKDEEIGKKALALNNRLEEKKSEIEKKAAESIEKTFKPEYAYNFDLREYDVLAEKAILAEKENMVGLANSYFDTLAGKLSVKLEMYRELGGARESEIKQLSDLAVQAYMGIARCCEKKGMFKEANYFGVERLLGYSKKGIIICNAREIEMFKETYERKAKMLEECRIEEFAEKPKSRPQEEKISFIDRFGEKSD